MRYGNPFLWEQPVDLETARRRYRQPISTRLSMLAHIDCVPAAVIRTLLDDAVAAPDQVTDGQWRTLVETAFDVLSPSEMLTWRGRVAVLTELIDEVNGRHIINAVIDGMDARRAAEPEPEPEPAAVVVPPWEGLQPVKEKGPFLAPTATFSPEVFTSPATVPSPAASSVAAAKPYDDGEPVQEPGESDRDYRCRRAYLNAHRKPSRREVIAPTEPFSLNLI